MMAGAARMLALGGRTIVASSAVLSDHRFPILIDKDAIKT
jgi:hypothetical protein